MSTNFKNEEETFENLSSNDHCPSYFSSTRKIWWNNIRSEPKMEKYKNLMKNRSLNFVFLFYLESFLRGSF